MARHPDAQRSDHSQRSPTKKARYPTLPNRIISPTVWDGGSPGRSSTPKNRRSDISAQLYRGLVPPPYVEEVKEGVFAYIHPDGSWGLSNSGFVAHGEHVAAIDSLMTEDRTRRFLSEIVRITGHAPEVLVNTHHHSDHTFGNFVLEEALVVGHRDCRDDVLTTGLSPMAQNRAVPWGDIRLRPPQLVFSDTLEIYVGHLRVELIHVGPAHTRGDIIAWLPEQRVIFAGDVLFNAATPIIMDGSLTGSVAALQTMQKLDAEVIVPGHGAVCGREAIMQWLRYFDFLEALAEDGVRAGAKPLDVAREADLGEFAGWQHPDRIVLNINRAMAEVDGTEPGARLDSKTFFAEMLEFNPRAYGHKIVEGREHYVGD